MPAFAPTDLPSLTAWYKADSLALGSGAPVDTWPDLVGGHHFSASGSARPTLTVDSAGLSSLDFDGVNDFMQTPDFTINSPLTIYLFGRQVTWTVNDRFMDGKVSNTLALRQADTTPNLRIDTAGGSTAENGNLTLNTYAVITMVIPNGTGSVYVNNGAAASGTTNATGAGGMTLARAGADVSGFGNISLREMIVYGAAHDSASRALVRTYLNDRWINPPANQSRSRFVSAAGYIADMERFGEA